MSDQESDHEEEELDLSSSDVVTKYKAAAEILNNALSTVAAACKAGAGVVDLCDKGDAFMTEAVAKVFKGKSIEKGIANPTCISVNNCVCYFSPLSEDTTELKDGDVVKIDMGCHIDGFIATAATTIVVQTDPSNPVTGRAADLLAATNTAFEAAIRLIRPGKMVADVAEALTKAVEPFGCTLLEGVLTHQLKQFIIDGTKCVLNKPSPEAKVEDAEFFENEVYAIDIVVSTGEGKARVLDEKETTVYKRALEMEYQLKMKASRAVFSEINKRFPTFPFSLRALDTKQSRLGLVECINHGLLHPYPVLYEKNGELVAQLKGTVLLMPNGQDRVTVSPLQQYVTDKAVKDEDLKKLLQTSLKSNKKKKKKGKKGGDTQNGAADATEDS